MSLPKGEVLVLPSRGPGEQPWRTPIGPILLASPAALINLVFSFGMLFATDGCGAGATDAAVCDTGVWAVLLALPWLGLAGMVLLATLGRHPHRHPHRHPRRHRWAFLLAGIAVYVVTAGVTFFALFG